MSCRRVSRELLERFRFGEELDPRSAPHLEHLQSCHACREEVGIERSLVIQLRRALLARVDGHAPSASSWELVRERAMAPESVRSWQSTLLRRAGLLPVAAIAVLLFASVGPSATPSESQASRVTVERDWAAFEQAMSGPATERWELPWWLRYRPSPPPPAFNGPLAMSMVDYDQPPPPQPVSGRME